MKGFFFPVPMVWMSSTYTLASPSSKTYWSKKPPTKQHRRETGGPPPTPSSSGETIQIEASSSYYNAVADFWKCAHTRSHEHTEWLLTTLAVLVTGETGLSFTPLQLQRELTGGQQQVQSHNFKRTLQQTCLSSPRWKQTLTPYPKTSLCREGQLWKQNKQLFLNRLQELEANNVQVLAHEAKETTQKEGFP